MSPPLSPELIEQLQMQGVLPPGPLSPQAVQAAAQAYQPPPTPSPPPNMFPPTQAPSAAVAAQRAGLAAAAQRAGTQAQGVFADSPGAAGAGGSPPPAANAPFQLPQGRVVGGGFRSNVSPGVRQGLDQAGDAQQMAAAREGVAAAGANDAGAAALDELAAKGSKLSLDAQLADRVRKDALDQQADEYRAMQQEAAQGQIDPERWYGNHSKAVAAVAMALGAFGSGLTRGRIPNWAAQSIQSRIDADIDAQKANLANKHKAAEASGNLFALKLRQFGDERQADLAARATMLEQYKLTADAEAKRAQSPLMMAKAQSLIADLGAKQAELHAKLESYVPPTVQGGMTPEQKSIYDKSLETALSAGNPVDEARTIAARAAGFNIGSGAESVRQKPREGAEKNKEEQDQLRDYDTALDYLGKIKTMVEAGGQVSSARTAQGQALVGGAANAMARAEAGKRPPSEGEMELIHKQVPIDPNAFQFTGASKAQIETTIAQIRAARDRLAGGARPAGPTITPEQ